MTSVKLFDEKGNEIIPESIHSNTGLIRLQEPLKENEILYSNFEFDVVVRFMKDKLEYSFTKEDAILINDAGLQEVYE